ncbi:HEAT repeat domain-containing protein [uncultured Winogradskyella sp.]|uniref:HEAT repeat domain-containing protein n=1 Tax=uncultured Winogradskyella sp. TaxID=395353 RepID=UPI002611E232|nr:HEAT repeat domain-containing protein [uncultured Winogradskyella sp.]
MKIKKPYKRALILFLIIFNPITAIAQEYGITVFGTNLIIKEDIIKNHTEELDTLKILYTRDRDKYKKKKADLENKLMTFGDFSLINVQLIKSYTGKYDFILDLVETSDAKTRLNFREIDTIHFDDPDNLIAKWQSYEDYSYRLFKDGEIKDYSCPVIHCLWSFNHLKLKSYLEFFNTYAPKHKDRLIEILNSSKSPNKRASAAFLLAHSEISNEDLLKILMPSIYDPERNVRNNSMRVIYYIVRAYPDIKFDISKVIDALDFPSFTDRNKALVILRSISLDNLKKEDSKRLSRILVEILEKKDAHNYKNAYIVIKKLSKKDFAIDAIENWGKWQKTYFKD